MVHGKLWSCRLHTNSQQNAGCILNYFFWLFSFFIALMNRYISFCHPACKTHEKLTLKPCESRWEIFRNGIFLFWKYYRVFQRHGNILFRFPCEKRKLSPRLPNVLISLQSVFTQNNPAQWKYSKGSKREDGFSMVEVFLPGTLPAFCGSWRLLVWSWYEEEPTSCHLIIYFHK